MGFFAVPNELSELLENVKTLASESYSTVNSPAQFAAVEAYSSDNEDYLNSTVNILSKVGNFVYENLSSNKIRVNIVERKPLAIINLKEQLMIDGDAVILPNHHYINSVLIPILSGFNPEKDLYPHGEKTYSIKVRESVSILNQLSDSFPNLYNNISELTLNNNDEYVIILSDKPTRVILGKDNILKKLNILKNFDKALGQRQLTDFQLLDMRYNKQLIAREWT